MKYYFPFLCMLLTSACHAKKFDGLKLNSFNYVERANIGKTIGEAVSLPIIQEWMDDDFIVLDLIVPTEIINYVVQTGSTFVSKARFCDAKKDTMILGIGDVYRDTLNSGNPYQESDFFDVNNSGAYQVVLFVSWKKDRTLPAM